MNRPSEKEREEPVSRSHLVHIRSIEELRAAAPAWDDLWWRSDVTVPTTRAELLAQWVEQFAPRADFHALVVERQGEWAAALPLVSCFVGRVFRAGGMPINEWSSGGDLMLGPGTEVDAVGDLLVAAMADLPWPLLWLDNVQIDAPRWKILHRAIVRAGLPAHGHGRLQVARIEIDHDWEANRRRWSRKHRQQMSRAARRLAKEGPLRLEIHSRLEPEQVESWMLRAFEIEDRGWKGAAGTSVLRTPGMFRFFVRQAERLARWGQLELAFLQCGGRPVAFAYGFSAKGVFHSYKVGYRPEYAAYSPGQLLRYLMLERFHGDPKRRAIDCTGPIAEAHWKWRPATYTIGRLVVAPRRLAGRVALHAYKHWWPRVRRFKGSGQSAHGLPSVGHEAAPPNGRPNEPANVDDRKTAPQSELPVYEPVGASG